MESQQIIHKLLMCHFLAVADNKNKIRYQVRKNHALDIFRMKKSLMKNKR